MARAFIGVGSNIQPENNVRAALRHLRRAVCVVNISTFYRTPPLNRPRQPPFINGVVEVETDLPPRALKFDVLRRIEELLGRRRTDDKDAPRTIDLDMLIYDEVTLSADELTLPDPEISRRAFLAVPLCELAPRLCLPGGQRLHEIAARFAEARLEPLCAYTEQLRKDLEDGSSEN